LWTLRAKRGLFSRLAGANRIETAVEMSRERYADGYLFAGGAVVLANAYSFADALAGSALAGALDGPLLLTSANALPAFVDEEIRRLESGRVYVLGGEGAVSTAVADAVAGIPDVEVIRVAGSDRIGTAAEVASATADVLAPDEPASVAFLVNGYSFPDALSAAPMAAYNWAPILLTHSGYLDERVAEILDTSEFGITDVVIVGGPAAVSASVESEVGSLLGGATHVRRIAGADRYETSRNFAVWATGAETFTDTVGTTADPDALFTLYYDHIGVASGENFPDALAGGVFCGLAGSPILLTRSRSLSPWIYDGFSQLPVGETSYYESSDLMLLRSYVFGGASAVSDAVLLSLDLLNGPGV
jgi:putative cell wall-binding protein